MYFGCSYFKGWIHPKIKIISGASQWNNVAAFSWTTEVDGDLFQNIQKKQFCSAVKFHKCFLDLTFNTVKLNRLISYMWNAAAWLYFLHLFSFI